MVHGIVSYMACRCLRGYRVVLTLTLHALYSIRCLRSYRVVAHKVTREHAMRACTSTIPPRADAHKVSKL